MKKKYFILTPVLGFFLYITLSSYSSGYPGSSTTGCGGGSCHGTSASPNTSISIAGLPAAGYVNGVVYTITLSVTNTVIAPASPFGLRDGFDISTSAGSFTAIANTTLVSATELRHTAPKAPVSGTASWTFNWTAPAGGSATVSFHVAGNATNGSGSANSADQWKTYSTTLIKAPVFSVTASAAPAILCNGGLTTITASSINGTAPFQYKINTGAYQSISAFPATAAGTYTITAKDGTNATVSTVLTVNQPTAIIFNSISVNNPLCNGGTGSATLIATGGTGTKTYTISPLGPQTNTSGNFIGLIAQSYTVTATDANSCAVTTAITVTQPAPLSVTSANVSGCSGNPISLIGLPAGGTFSVANPYTGPSTTYTYSYTNGSGCSATSAPSSITVTPVTTSNIVTASSSSFCGTFNQLSGTGTYSNSSCEMLATINASGLGSTQVCANYIGGSPTWNGEPYANKVYTISPTTQPSSTANVCLYYDASDLAAAGISTTADISITKVGGNGVLGGSGSVTEIPNAVMSITNLSGGNIQVCFPVSSFSAFYLHSKNPGNVPLPVQYADFNVKAIANADLMNWTTASEMNNDYFVVQHSNDGLKFTDIGQVNTKSVNSTYNIEYTFTNNKPYSGKNYYRLVQHDIDGNKTYSEIISVNRTSMNGPVSIYPNPNKGYFTVETTLPVRIQILDMNGKEVFSQNESSHTSVNLQHAGVYAVKLMYENGEQEVYKIVVDK